MSKKIPEHLLQTEKLMFALEASELGLWELNIQSGKGIVDKQWAEMLGYQLEEIESTMEFWNEIVHPEDKEWVLEELESYLTGDIETYSAEYRLRTKKGEWKWIRDQGKIIEWDEEGKPLTLVGTHRDIQERKLTEEILTQERNKLEAVIAALGDGLTVQDRNYKILYQNEIQKELQGEHQGNYCYKAYRGRDEICDGCLVAKCYVDGKVHRRETSITTHDGKHLFMEVSASPLKDSQGNIVAAVETVRDVTKRKLLEVQLKQSQKLEAVGTLAGGIAHDFNNILSVIAGYAELVQLRLAKDSELWKQQGEVLKASYRARDLVKQILAFSRQEQQELKPLQLFSLIQDTLIMLRASIPSSIEIKENLDIKAGTVLADPTQIHQVLMNLCTNAYHAMRETGGTLSISLQRIDIDENDTKVTTLKTSPGEYVRITVSDTGHGMDLTTQERIFDPYFTTKQRGDGTGLGLAVVNGIIADYNGFINVESEPQAGTSFNIYLPRLVLPSCNQDEHVLDILPKGSERILVVDDEEMIVNCTKQILEGLGYSVSISTSCDKALQMFSSDDSKEFDLIITDLTMPEMSGIELSEKILSLRPDIPIVLCTGFSSLIDEEKVKSLGIRHLFMKPVARKELAQVVRKILDN